MTNNYGHFAEPQARGSVFAANVTKGSVPICLLSMSHLSGRYHLGVQNVPFSEEHGKFMARYTKNKEPARRGRAGSLQGNMLRGKRQGMVTCIAFPGTIVQQSLLYIAVTLKLYVTPLVKIPTSPLL